jgi:hypothetical protein
MSPSVRLLKKPSLVKWGDCNLASILEQGVPDKTQELKKVSSSSVSSFQRKKKGWLFCLDASVMQKWRWHLHYLCAGQTEHFFLGKQEGVTYCVFIDKSNNVKERKENEFFLQEPQLYYFFICWMGKNSIIRDIILLKTIIIKSWTDWLLYKLNRFCGLVSRRKMVWFISFAGTFCFFHHCAV